MQHKTIDQNKVRSCIVGITGGIGCGKTTVAEFIRDLKYPVLFSDSIAQELIACDKRIQKNIKNVFGTGVFDIENRLMKKKLAEIVFSDSKKLQELNEIVHPKTIAFIDKQIQTLSGQNNQIIFVESALIYEAEIEGMFDYVIAVTSSIKHIHDRLAKQSKMTKDEIEKRLLQQIPIEEKANRSDFVIRNEGSLDELRSNTKFIVGVIRALGWKN